jgi:hypothetical protein
LLFRLLSAERFGVASMTFSKDQHMSRHRIPLALTTSVVALLSTSASLAQETTTQPTEQTTTTTTTPATTTTTAPPQQVQVVQPVQPVQPQVATTRTTSAPYGPASEDRYSERTVEHRPNRTLLSTGTGLFVLSYGSSVIAGAVSDRDADKNLFIPVVGPWMNLGDRGCTAAEPCGSNEDVAKAMIITSGVVQGAGILMALGSLIIPESTTVEERTRSAKLAEKKVHVLPISMGAGAGVGAVGRF